MKLSLKWNYIKRFGIQSINLLLKVNYFITFLQPLSYRVPIYYIIQNIVLNLKF